MWKDYSSGYIKNNRASGISIMAAAFIAALFLSFLCSLFYNIWVYEVEKLTLDEGDWQGRITGQISGEDLAVIRKFGNVERAEINEELSGEKGTVVDVWFQNPRTVFEDMPLLAEKLGMEEDAASYHLVLLSRYLIHDPNDEEPPLLMTFYLAVLVVVSLSLILIIRNSFALTMNARIHQFGIFSSVGATPGQIRTCLMQEAAALCTIPVILGILLGIALSFGVNQAMNAMAENIPGRYELGFRYHPLVFALTLASSVITVLFSAWLPARKLSRMTPLEAIRNTGELHLKKKKQSRILTLLFGVEGELAGNALKARKKALRTSTLSLTLSFLGFTLILCFFALSGISTRYTYFERYQDVWDVMATVKDTGIEEFGQTGQLMELEGVRDLAVYQKEAAVSHVPQDWLSEELASLGGPEAVAGTSVTKEGDTWLVKAPVVILDDAAFTEYCRQIGAPPRLDGTVILNRIWDSLHSNFRYPKYIPFVGENRESVFLQDADLGGEKTEVPVTAYTQEMPALREEYEDYALVQFMPLSLWEKVSGQIGGAESDTYIRILAGENASLKALDKIEKDVLHLLAPNYKTEIENRIQEKITNDEIIFGYQLILGGFCAILAVIGIANVFSNTLGFLRQRKRELAQYMSVGMTTGGIRKMFCIEALVIAGRPLLITLPLTVAAVAFMIKASHLNPMEFIAVAPIIPMIIFCLVIFGFVALAYYVGGKRALNYNLSDALRDDTVD
ncbi:ABC transporter permease [Faecalicatena contorta]|uniref:ABC transporter permease n=1 Tax=Faecalicatena contorta TaxID=39482 RepID=UPI001898D10D|nr:ABC transporter permease [Faecalicatena contorta]